MARRAPRYRLSERDKRMAYDPVLSNIQSNTRALLGLMVQLIAKVSALASANAGTAPEVDFMVDLFDRDDSDNLGSYWANPGAYVLRDNRAVPSATSGITVSVPSSSSLWPYTRVVVGTRIVGSDFFSQYASHRIDQIAGVGTMVSSYQGIFASPDITCELTFELEDSLLTSDSIVGNVRHIGPIAATGIAFSDAADSKSVALAVTGFNSTMYVGDELSGGNPANIQFGTPSAPAYQKPYRNNLNQVLSPSLKQFDPSALIVGVNTLRMTAAGNTYTATLNGEQLFSLESRVVGKRARTGLASTAFDIVSAIEALGISFYGFTSFKAWRSDMPQPLDQTGHGTYFGRSAGEANMLRYVDRYHTPILDAQKLITGYTYDPNAA